MYYHYLPIQEALRSEMPLAIALFLLLALFSIGVQANEPSRFSDVYSTAEIRQAFIAFVNLTTAPGVEGSSLSIDLDNRQSELWRSSVGFNAEFTFRNHIFNGFWGTSLIGGGLHDKIALPLSQQEAKLTIHRDIVAIRGSFGLSFPINQQLKIRPYGSMILSQSTTESQLQPITDTNPIDTLYRTSKVEAASGTLTLDTLYHTWIAPNHKLELTGQFNVLYTDSFSIDNPALDTYSWNQALMVKSQISGPTQWHAFGRRWFWKAYFSHNNYLDQPKEALGFRYLNELGSGLEWEINVKPMDWFGWRFIGLKAGYSFGDDVSGFNIGFTAR